MAQIVTLKDNTTGEYIYPMSSVKSVIDESGNSVEELLSSLDEKITQSGGVKLLGEKNNISEVIALTDSKVGNIWKVTTNFTLNGLPYLGGTSVICVLDTTVESHTEANWLALGPSIELDEFALLVPIEDPLDILD